MAEKKAETPKPQLWSAYFHKGPAPRTGIFEAADERTALLVATRWCLDNGCRPPASVTPMILANESILLKPSGPEVAPELVNAVAATTAVNSLN